MILLDSLGLGRQKLSAQIVSRSPELGPFGAQGGDGHGGNDGHHSQDHDELDQGDASIVSCVDPVFMLV